MTHEGYEHNGDGRKGGGFFPGLLLGGLIGGTIALLTAPQSGKETRMMIRDRAVQVRGQVEGSLTQAGTRVKEIASEARQRADEIQQSGQEFVGQQKARVERTARATTQAAKEAWEENPR
jgi:gas vesicle protein